MTTCKIEGCDRELYNKKNQWCKAHYENNRRTGNPLGARLPKSGCATDDCVAIAQVKGLCKRCYARHYYHARGIKPFNPNHPLTKAVPGYLAAHNRVRAARGLAKDHLCACGCGKQATDWALRAGTENVLFGSIANRETQTAYSLNPFDYMPMTASCHKAYDAATGNRNYKSGKYAKAGGQK